LVDNRFIGRTSRYLVVHNRYQDLNFVGNQWHVQDLAFGRAVKAQEPNLTFFYTFSSKMKAQSSAIIKRATASWGNGHGRFLGKLHQIDPSS